MQNETAEFVFEIIMETWPEWAGNQLYDTQPYAEFCGIQDYKDAFYDKWQSGDEDAEEPGTFKWEFISKGTYYLYMDDSPTDVSLRVRHVNSLTGE